MTTDQHAAMDALSIRLERIIRTVVQSIKLREKEKEFIDLALLDFEDALDRCETFGQRFAVAVRYNMVYSGRG